MIARNFLANLLGQMVGPLINLIMVPFFISRLGLEGYGLVGFLSVFGIILSIFTKGIGAAIQREMARRDLEIESRKTIRSLVLTFEVIYWLIGALVGLALAASSRLISTDWLTVSSIPQHVVRACIVIIALRVAISLPNSIYQSVFVSTQRQVMGNTITCISQVLSALMGFLVILIWGSVLGFYIVDFINAAWLVLVLRHWSRKILPTPDISSPDRFDWDEFKALWRFSFALMWSHGLGLLFTNMDRIAISKLLPVASLGVYNAGIAGSRLLRLAYDPFLLAVYPQTCQVAKTGSKNDLARILVRNTKVVMTLCMAVGLPLALFSRDILQVWTRNATVAHDGSVIMSIYICATILLTSTGISYGAQIALGKAKYSVYFNTIAIVWFPIAVWLLARRYGLPGAALAWLLHCIVHWIFYFVTTFIILLERHCVGKYLWISASVTAIGASANMAARHVAFGLFPDFIWGRLLIAAAGGTITFLACFVFCFGFHIPAEALTLFRKPKRSAI